MSVKVVNPIHRIIIDAKYRPIQCFCKEIRNTFMLLKWLISILL